MEEKRTYVVTVEIDVDDDLKKRLEAGYGPYEQLAEGLLPGDVDFIRSQLFFGLAEMPYSVRGIQLKADGQEWFQIARLHRDDLRQPTANLELTDAEIDALPDEVLREIADDMAEGFDFWNALRWAADEVLENYAKEQAAILPPAGYNDGRLYQLGILTEEDEDGWE